MTDFDDLREYAKGLREKGYNVQIAHYENGKEEIITISVIVDKKSKRGKDFYG